MTCDDPSLLECRVDIDASPARVWALVSDICRMAQWSPQVESTRLCDGETVVGLGTRFLNENSHGELRWRTRGEVVRFEPGREIAFRIDENWVVWSFRLEPDGHGGTVLVQRREEPDGISDVSQALIDSFMGGEKAFTEVMRDGMQRTVEAIKFSAHREFLA